MIIVTSDSLALGGGLRGVDVNAVVRGDFISFRREAIVYELSKPSVTSCEDILFKE